jgi:hypothetical protein
MLAKLIRGRRSHRLDPETWPESGCRDGWTQPSELLDRPADCGGTESTWGDRLIPVLLLSFQP